MRWTVATVFFLGVMAAAGYYVFNQALSGGQHVTVPNTVGIDLADASARIAAQGLDLGKPILVPHESIEKNLVLAQRPPADRVVRSGRKVHLTVSMGPNYLDAPNLLKMEWNKAQETLENAQFQVGKVARIPHVSRRDTVLAQDPPPGMTVENRRAINVLLSAGDESSVTFMPDLIGMSEEDARRALASLGVTAQVVEVTTEGAEANVVLRQDPQPDAYVYAGQVVRIEIKRTQAEERKQEYKAVVTHSWQYDWYGKRIMVRVVDRNEKSDVVATFSPVRREDQEAVTRMAGYGRKFEVTYVERALLEIWEDGERVEYYHLRQGSAPIAASAL